MNNQKPNILKLCLCAAFAALIFVATYYFAFPLIGGGYANLGDCFVILAGLILGPVYGPLAAGIGSAISDLLLGYGIYAPATLVIKAAMAAAAYFVLRPNKNRSSGAVIGLTILAAVAAELIMVLGYFVFEWPLLGIGAALSDIPGNLMQGAVGAVSSVLFYGILRKTGALRRLFK